MISSPMLIHMKHVRGTDREMAEFLGEPVDESPVAPRIGLRVSLIRLDRISCVKFLLRGEKFCFAWRGINHGIALKVE